MRGDHTFRLFGGGLSTSDGSAERDFIDVADIAEAHLAALEYQMSRDGSLETLNLGGGRPTSVLEFLRCFEQVTGSEVKLRREPPRAGDPERVFAVGDKARSILEWEPVRDLEMMIRGAVARWVDLGRPMMLDARSKLEEAALRFE